MTPAPGTPPHPPRSLSRRGFIGSLSGMALLIGSGSISYAQSAPLPLQSYPPSFFTAPEWRFVLAAVDRIIPEDGDGPGALTARVPVFLDRDLASPYGSGADWYMQGPHDASAPPELGWQTPLGPAGVYREAIAAIEAWCQAAHGRDFAALDPAEQDRILTALEAAEIELPPEVSGFFELFLTHVKEGYFADPIYGGNHDMLAWRYIGFPGARANFRDWVSKHNQPYQLGPVSISGQRA